MPKDYKRIFGRIERIIDKDYINGQLFNTRFELRLFHEARFEWTDRTEWLDFYGEIPPEFIGKEAKYFSAETDEEFYTRVNADIEIGTISRRASGICDLVENNGVSPSIPRRITSQLLKQVKGHVVFPYEYLKR